VDVSIGARIKAARTAAGMTQMDVARRTDLSLQAVGDIERGIVRDPHISSLRQIAYALDVPVEILVKEEEAEPALPLREAPEQGRAEQPEAPHELPRTRLTDTAPEDFNRRLTGLESAKEAAELFKGIRKEEEALATLLAGTSNPMPNPKLVRALIYRAAILDRWAKLADTRRDPASNRFKSVEEIAGEIAAEQEWLKDLQAAEEKDRSAKGA
jgi:transcriptional regulator with XRE-family HTH domain